MPGQNAVLDQEERPVKDVAEHRQGQNPGEHISNSPAIQSIQLGRSVAPNAVVRPVARSNGSGCRAAPSRPTPCGSNFTLAYNLGNFLRTLATPEPIKDWSLTSLKEKLIKIGAKVVSHGRYVAFQMAEVAIP